MYKIHIRTDSLLRLIHFLVQYVNIEVYKERLSLLLNILCRSAGRRVCLRHARIGFRTLLHLVYLYYSIHSVSFSLSADLLP